MIICDKRRREAGWPAVCARQSFAAVAFTAALALVLLGGCASPGPPQPPSLKLPEAVTGLTASRVGDTVRLHWTTPSRTTDKLLIAGQIEAEICRETPAAAPSASVKAGLNTASSARKSGATAPCSPVVLRQRVTPGASEAVDALSPELTAEPARLIAYRVQLRNAAGRTAGATPAVFAASGPAPRAIEELRGRATKAGVVLEWRAEVGEEEAIELDRTILQTPTATATSATTTTGSGAARKGGLPGAAKQPSQSRFRVAAAGSSSVDAGGTIDRTAQIGHAYRYTAVRVRTLELGSQTLEVRSLASAEVAVEMKDIFPPEAPVGLVAVPGFAGVASADEAGDRSADQVGEQAQQAAIDLSWEPDLELRIAGYRVYRREVEGDAAQIWRRLNPELVPVASYRDPGVVARRRYAYRVTAVDASGNESAPSDGVEETAPAR
jgi:hypothetical protein